MKMKCDIEKIADSIISDSDRKKFNEKFQSEKFKWGIELSTCDKWTTAQQGKIWRDIGMAAKLLETSPNAVYSILKTSKPTSHLFRKIEWVGTKKRRKEVIVEKSLSQWTKEDCIDAFDLINSYLEMIINSVYQEVVFVNWSKKDNVELPDFEFTGKPFVLEEA